jgi:hypothetical protein
MIKTKFCLLSLLLVIMAVGVHGVALSNWSRSTGIRAQAVSVPKEQKAVMRKESDRFMHRGSVFSVVGLCLAVAGTSSLIISFRRHEPARWRAVPVALLVFYVIFQFVMV